MRRRKSNSYVLKNILTISLILGIAFGIYNFKNMLSFNPQEIVDGAILKKKNFKAEIKEVTSPKYKIKSWLMEDKTNPIISINFMFDNIGSAYDNNTKVGLANLVAAVITEGTKNKTSDELDLEMERKAISISFDADKTSFSGSLLTTKKNKKRAFEILGKFIKDPRLDIDDIERVKLQFIAGIKKQEESPYFLANQKLNKELFGEHPYSRVGIGKIESIKNISKADIANFVSKKLVKENLIIGVSGDITPEEISSYLDRVFGELKFKQRHKTLPKPKFEIENKQINMKKNFPQNVVMFAGKSVKRTHKDFYPLYIANYILGGGSFSSRLVNKVREKNGLVYSIATYLGIEKYAPMFNGYFATTEDNFENAKNITLKEIKKIAKNGITKKELQNAKAFLIGSFNLRFSSISDISSMLVAMQYHELGIDFLEKRNDMVKNIKLDEVNEAIKTHIKSDELLFVKVGNN